MLDFSVPTNFHPQSWNLSRFRDRKRQVVPPRLEFNDSDGSSDVRPRSLFSHPPVGNECERIFRPLAASAVAFSRLRKARRLESDVKEDVAHSKMSREVSPRSRRSKCRADCSKKSQMALACCRASGHAGDERTNAPNAHRGARGYVFVPNSTSRRLP